MSAHRDHIVLRINDPSHLRGKRFMRELFLPVIFVPVASRLWGTWPSILRDISRIRLVADEGRADGGVP